MEVTLYSTLREGNNAALITMLFDVILNEAVLEMEASESFILAMSTLAE